VLKCMAPPNVQLVHLRKEPEDDSESARQIHRAALPRYLEISARARSVAPRLLSTSCFAFSPILWRRSGLRTVQSMRPPASSGLSTWMAASAATKREAISAKFSMEGPKTGIFTERGGFRILCPPEGRESRPRTRHPPAVERCDRRYCRARLTVTSRVSNHCRRLAPPCA